MGGSINQGWTGKRYSTVVLGETTIANHYEDQESMALWQRAQLDPILREYLYHIPLGGKRNPREAKRMKRMGTRKGVSDYHLPVARGAYHGLYVELKPDVKGYYPNISPEQIEWRDKMRNQDYLPCIVKGWEQAIRIMLTYLDLKDGERMLDLYTNGKYDCYD